MTQHHRAATIFAGIFSLIQSIIWVVLSIVLIASYTCNVDLPFNVVTDEITPSYLLYVTYFKGICRGGPVPPSASRTYIFMIIYAVVSAVWIPISVLLLVASFSNVKGRQGACLHYPWIALTSIIQIVDLIGTIVYGIDISNTMTVSDYKRFISPVDVTVSGADGITVIPAVEMTAFFSRAIIIWCINLILIGVVIQRSRCVVRMAKRREESHYTNNITQNSPMQCQHAPGEHDHNCGGKRWVTLFQPGQAADPYREDRPPSSASQGAVVRAQSWAQNQEPPSRYPPWSITGQTSASEGSQSADSSLIRIYDVNGRPLAEQQTPPSQRKLQKHVGIAGWSYTPSAEVLLEKRGGLRPVEPVIPRPDYTVHVPNLKRYPSLPGGPGQEEQENAGRRTPARPAAMSNVY